MVKSLRLWVDNQGYGLQFCCKLVMASVSLLCTLKSVRNERNGMENARVNAENIYATTFLITSYVTKNDTSFTIKSLASVSEIPNAPKILSHLFSQFSV